MKRFAIAMAFAALALLPILAAATDLTPQQLIEKSNEATASAGSTHQLEMTMTNKRGETQVQKMLTRSKTIKGNPAKVTTFLFPEESKGTKFLLIEYKDKEDDMKIFIPDLRRVRTITTTQRNQNYMGTDFSYADLEARNAAVGRHTITGSDKVDGQDCWVLTSILDPKKGPGYSKMITWFRKDNFVAVKAEYYDKDGVLLKVRTIQDLYKEGNIWIEKKIIMKNVQTDHMTVIETKKVELKPIDDSYFTEQFLQQTDRL